MFDVSLSELAIVSLVAILVIGPKRLPAVAKTVGLVVGRVQRFMAGIKSELQATSESSGLAELQRELHNASIMARAQVEESLRQHQPDNLTTAQTEENTMEASEFSVNRDSFSAEYLKKNKDKIEDSKKGDAHE